MSTLLQINATLNSGSTGRIAEQIAMKAREKGWECYHAHGGRYVGKSQFDSIQVSSKYDNYVHAFVGEYLGRHGLGSAFYTKNFVKKVKELSPDIIHLHNIHGYYLNFKLLFEYIAETKTPVVWTLHDCWSFTGHCTHFENAGCYKWKTECGHCPLKLAQYKSRVVDRSRKNFLLKKELYSKLSNVTIVPVSHWLENLVEQSILNRFKIRVIQNGIDLNVFKPTDNKIRERLGIPENKMLVLGVLGSGFVEKGKEEFIELSKKNELQIVLVGLTGDDYKGLPDSVIQLGRTSSQAELAEFYSAADVMLNPTYNDTFPTINIESLACGTPVITYKTGGSPEILDENTGIVVEKGDVNGLIQALGVIKLNGKESYSEACRKRAEKLFNKDDRYEEYMQLYEEILKDNKG